MSTDTLESKLSWHSRDTGIPKRELKRLCILAGLEQLQKGELKIRSVSREKGEETKSLLQGVAGGSPTNNL